MLSQTERPSARASGFPAAIPGPRLILGAVLLLTLVGLYGLGSLRQEEDILVFLPGSDPDVATFKDVARRFGALRVAILGVEPPPAEKLFSPAMLGRLDRVSRALKNIEGVDRVVSLSTMTDLDASAGGVEIRALVPSPIPTDPAELYKLEARALSLPQVRGNIVSADGKAAQVLIFLAEGASTRKVVTQARDLARQELAPCHLYYGGAPFAGQAIYDETQVDVRRLTPLAMLVFLVVVLLSFRDPLAVVLTVGTVAVAGIWVLGGMGLLREPFTVVTGTLMMILFSAGSQYAIHVLGRYYLLRGTQAAPQAAAGAVQITFPPLSIAAATTALGFFSFLIMNIRPMRAFGVVCGVGIILCWGLSLTVLPAVVAAWPRPSEKPAQFRLLERPMERLWSWVQRHRAVVIIGCALVMVVFGRFSAQVTVRMEPRAFFRPGSEPAEAQAFLDSRFGGSQFVQVAVHGDLLDPLALRELVRLGAYARSLEGVTQVQSIADPLFLIGEAMGTGKGLPAQRDQISNLLFFLEGEPSVRTLLAADHRDALLHVRLQGEPAPVLARLEAYLGKRWPYSPRPPTLEDFTEQVSWVLPAGERPARLPAIRAVLEALGKAAEGQQPGDAGADAGAFREALVAVLAGEEGSTLPAEARRALLAAFGPGASSDHGARWITETLPGGLTADQATILVEAATERMKTARREAAQRRGAEALLAVVGDRGALPPAEVRAAIDLVVASILNPVVPAPAADKAKKAGDQALQGRISGEPVLDRGFSRAVDQNQWASLEISFLAVFAVLLISLRSVYGAILCILPAGLALTVVFGVLGLIHQPIDIGTSLVGSIVTGSGSDFSMHYIWYLRRSHPKDVVRTVGPVLFTTAVLLGAGLGVLALGNSPPIRLFGELAAGGMLLSAAFTFLLVPALLRKVRSAGT